MASGLDKLVKTLNPQQFMEMKKCFPDDKHFGLLTRKGVFPYNYVTDISVLNDSNLSPKEAFYNDLTSTDVTYADYGHAQKVWRTFSIQSLGEYSDLYLKTDVLLLADVFENFRAVCIKSYDLDPCQYLTAPILSFDAMLKYTGVKLDLLTDVSMYHYIKKGIRGGLTQCSGRHSKANNKYMENYKPDESSKYLAYLDANNLYGWAMSQYLPISGFRWMVEDKIKKLQEEILNIASTADKGYILEVDLEYPEDLHNDHNDLPFRPETMIPSTPRSKTPKLLATLFKKSKYIIHYRNRYGLKLAVIHCVLEFNQSAWLKTYIDLNTRLRTSANNAFEKDFYKLMNNAIFGKTMANLDKRVNVKMVTRWERDCNKLCASNLIAKSNFNSCMILGENLVIIQMDRVKVTYDKPIYAGFSILDLSKTLMYDFHYGTMKHLYGPRLSLLYTDTDSLVYSVETQDLYSNISTNIGHFDTSDYPLNNKYNMPLVNKKVLGKFKDEFNGDLVLEFVGSRTKSYCIVSEKDIVKKIKGVSRNVVSGIGVSSFREVVVNNDDALLHTMVCIRSIKHQLYTQLINKVSLSGDDDKRYAIPGSTSTYAWRHKDIR